MKNGTPECRARNCTVNGRGVVLTDAHPLSFVPFLYKLRVNILSRKAPPRPPRPAFAFCHAIWGQVVNGEPVTLKSSKRRYTPRLPVRCLDRIRSVRAKPNSGRLLLLAAGHGKKQLHGLAVHPTDPDVYATVGDDAFVRVRTAFLYW